MFSVRCFESYGMTETLIISSQSDFKNHDDDASVGLPLPMVEIQVRSQENQVLGKNKENMRFGSELLLYLQVS